jgi:hypothetical protein
MTGADLRFCRRDRRFHLVEVVSDDDPRDGPKGESPSPGGSEIVEANDWVQALSTPFSM